MSIFDFRFSNAVSVFRLFVRSFVRLFVRSFGRLLAFGVVFKSALGGIWAGFWRDFEGFGRDFGRVLGGLGKDFRTFWVILVYYGQFSMIGLFLVDFRKIFAGAPCCLLLLS